MEIKHPEVSVQLLGIDGNAFNVLGVVSKAMRRAGVAKPEIDEFMKEATSGDYDHLLQTVMKWVTTDETDDEGEEGKICPRCGRTVDDDGYCPRCQSWDALGFDADEED